MPKSTAPVQEKFNPDSDRYPTLDQVISAIQSWEDFPTGQVERIEVFLHASGEATWRVWTPRAEEPLGGYVAKF